MTALVGLTGCSTAHVALREPGFTGGARVAIQADPRMEAESNSVRPTRYKNLDRAMEIQAGTQIFANFDTVLRFDSPLLGKGVPIDFESDLGFDDRATITRLDLKYSLGRRHRLEFSYFNIRRRANWILDKEIRIGDKVFPINIDVEAVMSTAIYKGAYRYLFAMGRDWDLSASIGLHAFGTGLSIEERLTINQGAKENFALPLPVFGLGGNLALSEKVRISMTSELFGIKIGRFKGYLVDARIHLDWDVWEQLGIGLGWNGFLTDIEVRDKYLGGDLLTGNFVYRYQGLLLYLRIFF